MANKEYYRNIYDLKTWLGFHITQLGYIRNLIITLGVAVLGYGLNNYPIINIHCPFIIHLIFGISLILLLLSIYYGLRLAINEGENYRIKRTISRVIEANPGKPDEPFDRKIIEKYEDQTDAIEDDNKGYAKKQFYLFCCGTFLMGLIFFLSKIKAI